MPRSRNTPGQTPGRKLPPGSLPATSNRFHALATNSVSTDATNGNESAPARARASDDGAPHDEIRSHQSNDNDVRLASKAGNMRKQSADGSEDCPHGGGASDGSGHPSTGTGSYHSCASPSVVDVGVVSNLVAPPGGANT